MNPYLLSMWLIWSGVAIILAPLVMRGRGTILTSRRHESNIAVHQLAIIAVITFFVWIGSAIIYGLILQAGTDENAEISLTGMQEVVGSIFVPLCGCVTAIVLLHSYKLYETIGMTRRRLDVAAMGGLIGITIALPIVWWVLAVTLWFWNAINVTHPAKHALLEAMDQQPQWWIKSAVIFAAVVVAPLFEELLFRGLIQTCVRRASGYAWIGILASSLLFAGVHAGWTAPPIFVLAVLIGITYELTGSLWAAIIMHAAFNGFSIATQGVG